MSSFTEFEGKSIEKVTQKASKKLKIPLADLKYDVISYGSTGIFGLVGTKRAKIRVLLPEKKSVSGDEHAAETPAENKSNKNKPLEGLAAGVDDQEAINLGKGVLQRILDEITTDATIAVEKNSERISFNITNDNAAIIIGKRGQTLEAIQYLVEKSINRQNKARIRVQVDIEGYLENRKNSLIQLASRMAKKVKRTGKPASVGQMNAHDRRIVHLALKSDNRVRTQSLGDGFYRKLVIFPKKNASQKK
ncbi:RNA-binding cell elongation regulator Jag/EloR [Thermodesulfobacteriota bacterium]